MMGGLIAATILTLTFLPALYALAFKVPLRAGADAHGSRAEGSRHDRGRTLREAA